MTCEQVLAMRGIGVGFSNEEIDGARTGGE